MHNRMTSRRRKPAKPDGRTVPAQGETTVPTPVPRLPHERDESSDSQVHDEPTGKRMGEQALDDVRSGKVDTSKAAEMDRTYRQVKGGK